MWDGFFGGINIGNIVNNIHTGLSGAIATLNIHSQPSPPPHQVKTSQAVNQNLVAKAIAGISSAVDPEITKAFEDAEGKKMKLFGDLIADPYTYPNLSPSDKILVTQAVIEDLIRLPKPDQTNKDKYPINKILTRISEAGKDSFFNEYEAIAISNYYVGLNKTTEEQIPEETKQPSNFQCQSGGDPRNERAGGRDTLGRRSQNAFAPPPPLFPNSLGKENRTPPQLQKSKEMHAEMQKHIESERRKGSSHPAAQRPITKLPKWHSNQGLRTGRDAMNYVFKQGGITTLYAQTQGYNPRENTDGAIAKNLNNEHTLTREQLELTRGALKPLYKTGHYPESGSRNPRRTKDLSNISTTLKGLETKSTTDLAELAAINFLTKPPQRTQSRRVPDSAPAQPLSASRSSSLGNATGRR